MLKLILSLFKTHTERTQSTFCYCSSCGKDLISGDGYVREDDDYVFYRCKHCGLESKWDFDFPCPILVE